LAAGAARVLGQSRKLAHISFFAYSTPPRNLKERLRRRIFNSGVRNAGTTILMTRQQVSEVLTAANCQAPKVSHLPVGVDTRFFRPLDQPNTARGIAPALRSLKPRSYVVIAGDQLRDDRMYLQLMTGQGLDLVRLTQNRYTQEFWNSSALRGEIDYKVTCKAHLTAEEVRYVYRGALCAINLLDNTEQPSGWTVMTEAMACGLPVIANTGLTTVELRSYLTPNQPLPYVEIDTLDAHDARIMLRRLSSDESQRLALGYRAREFIDKHLAIECMARRVASLLEQIAAAS
jgi:glycosyltransferase involved in cell wall biosynthesis